MVLSGEEKLLILFLLGRDKISNYVILYYAYIIYATMRHYNITMIQGVEEKFNFCLFSSKIFPPMQSVTISLIQRGCNILHSPGCMPMYSNASRICERYLILSSHPIPFLGKIRPRCKGQHLEWPANSDNWYRTKL